MPRHDDEGGLIPIAHPTARQVFRARVQPQADGGFVATCDSPVCMSRATTEAEALEKLRSEIRYRLELCPCTGMGSDAVQLDVDRVPPRNGRTPRR